VMGREAENERLCTCVGSHRRPRDRVSFFCFIATGFSFLSPRYNGPRKPELY